MTLSITVVNIRKYERSKTALTKNNDSEIEE